MGLILILVIVALMAGALPLWPHSKSWGYAPSGALTFVLVIFLLWALSGDRSMFHNDRSGIRSSMNEAGQDLKSAGRDVGDSIRRTVQ